MAVTTPASPTGSSNTTAKKPDSVALSYVFTDLGAFSGGNSTAYGISENGHVVGTATLSNGSDTHAFEFWNGAMRDLGTLKGAVGSGAFAVNNADVVVGYGNVASTGAFHALRFAATGPVDLNAAASANYSAAEGINEAGQVVGFIQAANPNPNSSVTIVERAFVSNHGAITLLPALGGNSSEATCINNLSQIVGVSDLSGDVVQHAFLYAAGHSKDLGVISGAFSEALHINDSSQVVGVSDANNGGEDAFLYSGGLMQDLGTLGGNLSVGYCINNSGDIVGYSSPIPNNPSTDAFIYSDGVMTDLNDLTMTGAGGHTMDAALAINNAGQIVGEAVVGSSNSTTVHAFLLTPTDKATPPSLSIGLTNAVKLKGDSVTFSATFAGSDPMTYQWYKNGAALAGKTDVALTLTNLQVAASGNYLVKASNLVGEMSSNMTLTVLIPPTFSKSPVNTNALTGKPAKLTVTATGTPPLTYQWQISTDGGTTWSNVIDGLDTATGNTSAMLNFATTILSQSGDQFRCVVTNPGTTSTTAPATLFVGGPPSISVPPVNLSTIQGQDANFTVTATGSPTPTYQWFKGKNLLVGKTASSLTIPGAQPADADTYSVTVANPFKTITAKATLKIIVPPGISKQPVAVSVAPGKSAKFTITATGTAKLSYQWSYSRDGGASWAVIPKANSNTYTIAKTTIAMDGQIFRCGVDNASFLPIYSNEVTLTVGP